MLEEPQRLLPLFVIFAIFLLRWKHFSQLDRKIWGDRGEKTVSIVWPKYRYFFPHSPF